MREELHRQIPPVRGYPARIPRVQAPHAQSRPAPNAGWPGIQTESHPASSLFPSPRQITPMNIQPIQPLPLLPPSNLPNASLWAISLFFSPNAQNPVKFWALGRPFSVPFPKSQDFLNFPQKKPRFLGTGEKKRLICPSSGVRTPTPYPRKRKHAKKLPGRPGFQSAGRLPLYPYSVSRRLLPLARCRAHICRWPGDHSVFPRTGQACYSAAANLRWPLVKSPLALPGFLCYSRTGLDPRPGTGAQHIYIPGPRLAGIPWGCFKKTTSQETDRSFRSKTKETEESS